MSIFFIAARINDIAPLTAINTDMRLITCILATIGAAAMRFRAPIESFDAAATFEMGQTLGTMFADTISQSEEGGREAAPDFTSSDEANSGSGEYEYEYEVGSVDIASLSDRTRSAAQQVIYHESTSAARLRLLIAMNQMYSSWISDQGLRWSANPKSRCDSIRAMLSLDMSSIPAKYREDTISGWLLFCSPNTKFEKTSP